MSRAALPTRRRPWKAEHPWLAQAGGGAALATWRCWPISWASELLMKPADYRHLPLFCATNQRDKLSLRVELVGASINRTGLCWI